MEETRAAKEKKIVGELSLADFEKFKGFVKKWISLFGLHDWDVSFAFEDDNDTMAYITYSIPDRMVKVFLSKDWVGTPVTDAELDKVAFHETCEILLVKLRHMKEYPTCENVGEEVHRVIRILENTILEKLQNAF